LPHLTEAGLEFVTERHLATLTTLRSDGSPHVTAVGFTWDAEAGLARVICSATSQKAVNAARMATVALCQVDGRRWLTVEGRAEVHADAPVVAEAVERYARRYRQPRDNPARVALVVRATRLLGSSGLIAG
jgi:PPOX class probable F420-dependent enzyme